MKATEKLPNFRLVSLTIIMKYILCGCLPNIFLLYRMWYEEFLF